MFIILQRLKDYALLKEKIMDRKRNLDGNL